MNDDAKMNDDTEMDVCALEEEVQAKRKIHTEQESTPTSPKRRAVIATDDDTDAGSTEQRFTNSQLIGITNDFIDNHDDAKHHMPFMGKSKKISLFTVPRAFDAPLLAYSKFSDREKDAFKYLAYRDELSTAFDFRSVTKFEKEHLFPLAFLLYLKPIADQAWTAIERHLNRTRYLCNDTCIVNAFLLEQQRHLGDLVMWDASEDGIGPFGTLLVRQHFYVPRHLKMDEDAAADEHLIETFSRLGVDPAKQDNSFLDVIDWKLVKQNKDGHQCKTHEDNSGPDETHS